MSLREMLSDYWYAFQQELFPRLESELGPMGERYELFVAVLELVRVEALLPYFRGQVGRPEEDRAALARAFIAKAVFDIPTTRGLIERLEVDGRLCRLCGWSGAGRLPSEATFSRAFSEFAESGLASRLHETLIARTMDGHLVEHISRDATAIEAREKPAPKPKAAKPKRRQRRLKIRPKGGAKDCHLGWWSDLGVRLGVGDAVRGFFGGSGQRSHAELKRSAPAGRPQGGMVYRIGVSLATRALGARCRPGPSDGVPQFSYRHCFCGRGFG